MKTTYLALAAGTALTLSMTAAFSGENDVYLDQDGNRNDASIEQDGSDNAAGADGTYTYVVQSGSRNKMEVKQEGDGNKFGVKWGGVDQMGDRNYLDAQQEGGNNEIINIGQFGGGSVAGFANTARISQDGEDNLVRKTAQAQRGSAANRLAIVQDGDDNTVGTLDQDGTGNLTRLTQLGSGNTVNSVMQGDFPGVFYSSNGSVVVVQNGENNLVDRVVQNGVGNSASIRVRGDRNGAHGWAAWNDFSQLSGAEQGSVLQDGEGNTVDYLAAGDDNRFGFSQYGNDNSVGRITVVGDANSLGVTQSGDRNTLQLGTVNGNSNDIGLAQWGDDNSATLNMTAGSDNNRIGMAQVFGDGNEMTINIAGDNNNTGGLSGTAASIGIPTWLTGVVGQVGSDNSFSLSLTGHDNSFASGQIGDDNNIEASVDGSSNQFAVLQYGDSNNAVFSQTGYGNNIGISQ